MAGHETTSTIQALWFGRELPNKIVEGKATILIGPQFQVTVGSRWFREE
jgi:hypothetical protein